MHLAKINIGGHNYTLAIGYHDDEVLRNEFNRLTQEVWKFDFENYYQLGLWDDSCIIYSLFDKKRIVSHITVTLFDSEVREEKKKILQFGTVMTDPEYRNRGLSRFLMERVITDFGEETDGMLLFANKSVLDFYPKFGFQAAKEYQAFKNIISENLTSSVEIRKLDMNRREDIELLTRRIEDSIPNTQLVLQNKAVSLLYCYAYPKFGYTDSVYYIENLDTAVVASVEADVLEITEIFSENIINLQDIIAAFSHEKFTSVRLGFIPLEKGFEYELLVHDDLVLYISEELRDLFGKQQLTVPFLSHT
ncbi:MULTISPECIES: GNAT family N-acetyltransferase [Elizabethkingia]|uniref:Predicted acetyltransferase involved in intracellular survival and related acetyltransferases n=1 Tax=Elizabethkingia anophelis TaxID=1117645 RepID=A0A7Z7LTM9_9FLAO|nr:MULTISPECIES: GNAT family N-acetyltransferase [Elizabethkingia]AQW91660.1 GCN5 family acetyltransferase [Elizabethkingia anophelis]KUY18449.1 GCN5 family acetyltransferase [Elizabethkingia anophelis]MCT3629645.1 GNAT family N-acetyltransferase [Elizabethkingia anophelis]MCT3633413.1 GNAT family N-acetyltransferase [Elizabethkingia anophelis]MCT3669610.1 GNAT family N-acetyltransferase [Elizabethkingia anophelis]